MHALTCSHSIPADQISSLFVPFLIYKIGGKTIFYITTDAISKLSYFHSKELPPIKLDHYITRFSRYTRASAAVLVLATIYLMRVKTLVNVDQFSIHRLFFCCMMIALKFHEDCIPRNYSMHNIGGMSVTELYQLEIHLLHLLRFQLYVSTNEFDAYWSELCNYDAEVCDTEVCDTAVCDAKVTEK